MFESRSTGFASVVGRASRVILGESSIGAAPRGEQHHKGVARLN
jgi:hypothetical protein